MELLEDRRLLVISAIGLDPGFPLGATPVEPGTGYDGVVKIFDSDHPVNGTGTLLATGQHILTAAHVATGLSTPGNVAFEMPSKDFEHEVNDEGDFKFTFPPDWEPQGGTGGRGDIAVITLPYIAPFGAERRDIYTGDEEVWQTFTIVGYGNTGLGAIGQIPGSDGTKRIGYNKFGGITDNCLTFDFDDADDPSSDKLGDGRGLGPELEAVQGIGDSGGGAILEDGTVAGVMSVVGNNSKFGAIGQAIRVSDYTDFINKVLDPDPSDLEPLADPIPFVVNMNQQEVGADGTLDVLRFVLNGPDLELYHNGSLVNVKSSRSISEIRVEGSSDDETLIIDHTEGNPIPEGGIDFVDRGDGDVIITVPPLGIEAGPDQTATEGDSVALAEAHYAFPGDPSLLMLTVDWGDGAEEPGVLIPGDNGGAIANSHSYADDGPYTVTLTVTDDYGGTTSDTLMVTVENVAPAPTITGAPADGEGLQFTPITLGSTTGDPAGEADAPYTYVWEVATDTGQQVDAGSEATFSFTPELAGTYGVSLTVTDKDGAAGTAETGDIVVARLYSEVVGRHLFYNGSSFDGNDHAAGPEDDNAIAPDKTALLPGQTATFANYTSYSRGINGIMIDVAGLSSVPVFEDLGLKMGNTEDPDAWGDTPLPEITLRQGAGLEGSDRVTLIWEVLEDDQGNEIVPISKQWLQVTLLATPNTGLAEADVFYFGNAIGETGNSTSDAMVTSVDEIGARSNPRIFIPALIDDPYDFNRDRLVTSIDQIVARSNIAVFDSLELITAPAIDAVLEEASESGSWEATPRELALLSELEQLIADDRPSKKDAPVEEAVVDLLATYWV